MKLKINENLLKKMNNKFAFPNLIINQKEITIKEQDNIDISNDFSPLAFPFSLDQKIINKYSKIAKKIVLVKMVLIIKY